MFYALKKFLALHHHLSLPGIGNFKVETKPAFIDITNRTIEPLQCEIKFNNEKTAAADKALYHFLAEELNVDEAQAKHRFNDFTTQLQSDIKNNKPIVFEGIGTLNKQSSNALNFQPQQKQVYFPLLTAERIIRKNATHFVRVGEDEKTSVEMHAVLNEEQAVQKLDRWWIPAIVLGLIGIAALIYYYNVLHHHF